MQKVLAALALGCALGCATTPANDSRGGSSATAAGSSATSASPSAASAASSATVPGSSATSAPAPPPAPREVSAAALVDHIGDSAETAVVVPIDAPNEGVDFQNEWIFNHFGRFRRSKFAMAHAPDPAGQQRHYDIITVELPDGSFHEVFFDMTDFWAHVKPK